MGVGVGECRWEGVGVGGGPPSGVLNNCGTPVRAMHRAERGVCYGSRGAGRQVRAARPSTYCPLPSPAAWCCAVTSRHLSCQ